ncbi:DUF6153 family protein [Kitasatospora sp. NPDC057198]|uniref:DUF6153 family protein n=1 Tax=Kitasatospora sp. NPDC057198 TaxID=3346046 RepID=UPI00363E8B0B
MTERTGRTGRTGRATDPAPAGRSAARWAVLCALLLGLFLMHGSPASAADCHAATTATTATTTAAAARATTKAAHGGHGDDHPSATGPVRHGGSASSCVSTQARDRLPLPAPGPALPPAPPHPPLAGPPGTGTERGGRAPPDGGRELLLRVCVARR